MQSISNHGPIDRAKFVSPRDLAGIVLLVAVLALPRFGHTTPDSGHYAAMVSYFQGNLPREALETPFAFRWVMPWLASWLPGVAPATAIALCSLAATMAACGCFARLLAALVDDRRQWRLGMAFLALSFPTVNYGAAVLTDSCGFLLLAASAWAMFSRRYLALAALLVVGVGVRESTVVMLPALWLFVFLERDFRGMAAAAGITAAALLAVFAARWWFSDLPPYFWTPSWRRFSANLARPVSWATVTLCLAPVGMAALAGLRHWPRIPARTRRFIVAMACPCTLLAGYSVLAAFMSGRFCWPLYLALVPLAARLERGDLHRRRKMNEPGLVPQVTQGNEDGLDEAACQKPG